MEKEKYFVVGDIHGCLSKLKELLTYHNPKTEQLVFIGDYIDRGPDSKGVLDFVMEKQKEGAWCLKGNHEQLLENAIDNLSNSNFSNVDYKLWIRNGGNTTVDSFDLKKWVTNEEIYNELMKYNPFLNSLPYYKETNNIIFVHAGVDLMAEDWRNELDDMLWIRDFFHYSPNNTGKTIVFGHTPTKYLNSDQSNEIWFSEDNKIGLDGGAVFGGLLHAVLLDKQGNTANLYSVE